jgi:dTMP kinase
VRAAFLELAEAEPDRYLVLDARSDVDTVAAAILARVESWLEAV